MRVRFEENERALIAMLQKGGRQETIDTMRSVIPFIDKDGEMIELVNDTLGKLTALSDEAFLRLDLEPYLELFEHESVEDE